MKIGDLAKATNTLPETVRFYEREGLLPSPARTEGIVSQIASLFGLSLGY
jgi:DNA-binding transcriptional MerR regulator